MTPLVGPLLVPLGPPLTPSPDDARDQLRRELLKPDYYDRDVVHRVLAWLGRRLDGGVSRAGSVPPLQWLLLTALALAVVVGLGLLVTRTRRTARAARARDAVLTGERVSAAELRRRAERAFAAGAYGEAVVEAYRALALRQVERGRLDDGPGATAAEVARSLAAAFPDRADRLRRGGALFDAVLYGERPADREQAALVLGLDDELAATR